MECRIHDPSIRRSRDGPLCFAASIVIGCTATGAAVAADEPTAPVKTSTPSLSDVLSVSGISVTGYVAASFYHSSGYCTDHQFDTQHDSFQLDQAELTVAYQPKEGFGALVDVAPNHCGQILHARGGGSDCAYRQFEFLPLFLVLRRTLDPYGNPRDLRPHRKI